MKRASTPISTDDTNEFYTLALVSIGASRCKVEAVNLERGPRRCLEEEEGGTLVPHLEP